MIPDESTPVDPQMLGVPIVGDTASVGFDREDDDRTPTIVTSTAAADPSTMGDFDALLGTIRLLEQAWGRPGSGRSGPAPPGRIGRFEVIGELGRGGFGVVYKAHDPERGRAVALKVPHAAAALNPALELRFLREARAVRVLDHPNIAAIFEAGRAGPICYIASPLCDGPNLASWLHRGGGFAPPRVAASIVALLADAVQHAHGRGILHRDLKPSNVLLWPAPAGPSAAEEGPGAVEEALDFVPKLTDFGLARIVEEAGEDTRTGIPIGSPPYMAPEQAEGRNREVGRPADVYGLGAMLYELLTGRPPFRGECNAETIRMVLTLEVVPPRSLRPGVPRDLETICLACLEKEPRHRLASADALADDLRRFLAGRPVRTRRASLPGLAWRAARRRPWRTAALGLVTLAALGAFVGVSAYNARLAVHNANLLAARDQAERNAEAAERYSGEVVRYAAEVERYAAEAERYAAEAEAQRLLAERHLNASRLRETRTALDQGQVGRAQEILAQLAGDGVAMAGAAGDFAARYLRRLAHRDVELLRGHDRPVIALDLDPGGRLVSVDTEGVAIFWDLAARRPIGRASYPAPLWGMRPVRLVDGHLAVLERPDPDGERWPLPTLGLYDGETGRRLWGLGAGDADGYAAIRALAGGARLLDVRVRLVEGLWRPSGSLLDFDPDGGEPLRPVADLGEFDVAGAVEGADHFFTLVGDRLRRHDSRSGDVQHEVAVDLEGRPAYRLDPSPDGLLVFVGQRDGRSRVVDAGTGDLVGQVPTLAIVDPVIFAPEGDAAVIVERGGRTYLWDRPDGRSRVRLIVDPAAEGGPREVGAAFSPDGRLMALGNWGAAGGWSRVQVREVATGRLLASYPGRPTQAGTLAFTPDGRGVLLPSGVDVALWLLDPSPDPPGPDGHRDEAWAVDFHPDGCVLATGADDTDEPETIKTWDVATGRMLLGWKAHPATVSALAYSPDGTLLASASLAGTRNLRLWNPETGRRVGELRGHTDRVRAVAFSPDGTLLLSAGDDGIVRIWDVDSRKRLHELTGHGAIVRDAVFLPDGGTVASVCMDRTLRLWDVASAEQIEEIRLTHEPLALAVSPDGEILAVADNIGHIELFDARTGDPLRTIRDADGELRAIAFAPDGSAVAVAGTSRVVRLWDPVTGQELLSLDGHEAQINGLAFAPDGSSLASCSHDGAVRLWHADAPPQARSASRRPSITPRQNPGTPR